MSYPFVPAKHFTPGALSEARAILWHMAEGYGTVGYFTRVSINVSSHYVIDRTGTTTQMVRLADASHSAHWRFDADSADADDCGGTYDPAHTRALLGLGASDLNRYVVAVEVEGYRAQGPNAVQRPAMAELAAHLRRTLPSLRGNLGHRDVQDYKACPGCRFPWDIIGGHGRFAPEPPDTSTEDQPMQSFPVPEVPSEAHVRTGAWLYTGSDLAADPKNVQIDPGRPLPYVGKLGDVLIVAYDRSPTIPGRSALFVRASDVASIRPVTAPLPPPAPPASYTVSVGGKIAGSVTLP